ncbi:MAG: motility protein A [Firmicutes bacterium]|jgi:chemotaxis protein MotA|nr:motility protein A [Bacillota bacterium]
MNITYLIGLIGSFVVVTIGMMLGKEGLAIDQVVNFMSLSSVFITIGCTIFIVIASFPVQMLKNVPKHIKIMMNTKKYDPESYIDQLVEMAQVARKNGLLALEELGNQQKDPFFKQCIMLVVDNNEADRVREIMLNDIEQSMARHESVSAMYDRASSVAPAFGMVGTLVGLINMLNGMDSGSQDTIGSDMGTALITTLYGCVLAHMIFTPIANNLRARDEEEVLCKQIIVEGIMSIQSGANPKFIREKLLTFMSESERSQDNGGDKKRSRRDKS